MSVGYDSKRKLVVVAKIILVPMATVALANLISDISHGVDQIRLTPLFIVLFVVVALGILARIVR